MKRRMSYEYEFNTPHPNMSHYSVASNPYVQYPNNYNNNNNYNQGRDNFGRAREKEYDPFDPNAQIRIKK